MSQYYYVHNFSVAVYLLILHIRLWIVQILPMAKTANFMVANVSLLTYSSVFIVFNAHCSLQLVFVSMVVER